MREVLLASALQATADSGTAASVTLTISENGEIDPGRLAFLVARDAPATTGISISKIDCTPAFRLLSLTLNGAVLLVRGRNTPAPPLGIFDRLRARNFIGLPKVRVKTGDLLVASIYALQTELTAIATFCLPFAPDRLRGMGNAGQMDGFNEVIVGSPAAAIADTSATPTQTLTATFDADGLVDASRLVIQGQSLIDVDTTTVANFDVDGLDHLPLMVDQLIFSGVGYNMVVGGGTTPTAPNVFDARRSMNFVDLGIFRVSPGDTLTASIRMQSAGTLLDGSTFSMFLPQRLDVPPLNCGAIKG